MSLLAPTMAKGLSISSAQSTVDWATVFPQFEWITVMDENGWAERLVQGKMPDGSYCLLLPLQHVQVRSSQRYEAMMNVVRRIQSCVHPNLLPLYGLAVNEGGNAVLVYASIEKARCVGPKVPRMSAQKAVNILRGAGDGLEAAHQCGLAHGQLDPFWLLSTPEGSIAVAGVGVAQMIYPDLKEYRQASLRRPQGAQAYLAPELLQQEHGSELPSFSARHDIYSLGAIAYHFFTGSPVGNFVILPSKTSGVSKFTDDVVFRAIQKAPEHRQANAAEFARDIALIGAGTEVFFQEEREKASALQAVDQRRQRRRRGLVMGAFAGMAALIGGVLCVVEIHKRMQEPTVGEQASLELDKLRKLLIGGAESQESLLAFIGHAMQRVSALNWNEQTSQDVVDLLELAAAVGTEDAMIQRAEELLQRVGNKTREGQVNWTRVANKVQYLQEAKAKQASSLSVAHAYIKSGQPGAAYLALAQAEAWMPSHPRNSSVEASLEYDPLPALRTVLDQQRSKGFPLRYKLRKAGLEVHLDLAWNEGLDSLDFLSGQPITHLDVSGTALRNLTTLSALPLHEVKLDHTPITDLSTLICPTLRVVVAEDVSIAGLGVLESSGQLRQARIRRANGEIWHRSSRAYPRQAWVAPEGLRFARLGGSTQLLLADWETRVADFRVFAEEEPAAAGAAWQQLTYSQGGSHPVVNVSINEARAYCRWLTNKAHAQSQLPRWAKFRLPTSSEWTAATELHSSKPDRSKKHPWGDYWPPRPMDGNYPLPEVLNGLTAAAPADSSWTQPVGSFRNLCWPCDMGGNVREWATGYTSVIPVIRDASYLFSIADFTSPTEALLLTAESRPADGYRAQDLGFRVLVDFGLEPTEKKSLSRHLESFTSR